MKNGVLDHYEVLPSHARLQLLDAVRPSGECIQLPVPWETFAGLHLIPKPDATLGKQGLSG